MIFLSLSQSLPSRDHCHLISSTLPLHLRLFPFFTHILRPHYRSSTGVGKTRRQTISSSCSVGPNPMASLLAWSLTPSTGFGSWHTTRQAQGQKVKGSLVSKSVVIAIMLFHVKNKRSQGLCGELASHYMHTTFLYSYFMNIYVHLMLHNRSIYHLAADHYPSWKYIASIVVT